MAASKLNDKDCKGKCAAGRQRRRSNGMTFVMKALSFQEPSFSRLRSLQITHAVALQVNLFVALEVFMQFSRHIATRP